MQKGKRILAIIGIILLVGMYVATLILAITDSAGTMSMFKGSIALTIFVPVVIYAYTAIYKYLIGRKGSNES